MIPNSVNGTQAHLSNAILGSLPQSELHSIRQKIVPISLPRGTKLLSRGDRADHVYFLESGLASVDFISLDGHLTCVNLIGREGVVGFAAMLGETHVSHDATMQTSGAGYKVPSGLLAAEFLKGGAFAQACHAFVRQLLLQSWQFLVCQRLHSVPARLANCLLRASEMTGATVLDLTQEGLASLIGCTRPTLTLAAQSLRQAGGIDYRRGKLLITDRAALQAIACECCELSSRLEPMRSPADAIAPLEARRPLGWPNRPALHTAS